MDYLIRKKCKLYRSRGSEQKKKNNDLRKKLWRTKLKQNPMKSSSISLTNDTANYKTKKRKQLKCKKLEEEHSSSQDSSFSNKQTLHRSLSRADNHLPKSPHKKAEVIEKLVEKYHVKISFNTKHRRPREDLNEEEKNGLKQSFLAVTSATPTLEGKVMYMLAKLMANVAISNACIYCGICTIFLTL